jgi:BirA family biotin operon repressor/biotin-[acetyl-CoA-carboxylase] ligase
LTAPGADLLEQLADGRWHAGPALAAACGITLAGARRRIARLRESGWPIDARRGTGYRLEPGVRPLAREPIERGLAGSAARVTGLEVLTETASTSSRLAGQAVPDDGAALVCIAEHQTAGRGRRGRPWVAPAGGAVMFSLARAFERPARELWPLSFAAGVAVAEVLGAVGVHGVGLKWPNDVEVAGAKLAGILVEAETAGPRYSRAVIGIGLNHDLGAHAGRVGRPVTDLRRAVGESPDRSWLAGRLIARVLEELDLLERGGEDRVLERWQALDVLAGRRVRVDSGAGVIEGLAQGIDADGALRVRTDSGSRRFLAAEVSVRAAA